LNICHLKYVDQGRKVSHLLRLAAVYKGQWYRVSMTQTKKRWSFGISMSTVLVSSGMALTSLLPQNDVGGVSVLCSTGQCVTYGFSIYHYGIACLSGFAASVMSIMANRCVPVATNITNEFSR